MSARILIVDDLAPNRNLLEVKLAAEYYHVLTAENGEQALEIARSEPLDLILMDAMMPGIDGFEACRLLKSDPKLHHIPIVMVTALEETKDRVRGLEAGADDFITKPIDDFNLTARVRSLLRLKMTTDQLLSHTGHSVENSRPILQEIGAAHGNILVVDDENSMQIAKIERSLSPQHTIISESDPVAALRRAKQAIDLIIVNLANRNFDGLRLCASLRFNRETQDTPILIIGNPEDQPQFIRAYDLGVNDTIMRPIEQQELAARVASLLRRKFYADSLRDNFNEDLEMVVSDPLTGLGNRRYLERHTGPLLGALEEDGVPFSLLVFDIDHFKRVNDILGHDMGDTILKEIAARIVTNMRAVDIVSRYGGEEFLIAMPETTLERGLSAAERVRQYIAGTPVFVDGQALSITLSAGVAEAQPDEHLRDIFRRADQALYKSKQNGRNRVTGDDHEKTAHNAMKGAA